MSVEEVFIFVIIGAFVIGVLGLFFWACCYSKNRNTRNIFPEKWRPKVRQFHSSQKSDHQPHVDSQNDNCVEIDTKTISNDQSRPASCCSTDALIFNNQDPKNPIMSLSSFILASLATTATSAMMMFMAQKSGENGMQNNHKLSDGNTGEFLQQTHSIAAV